MTAGTSAPNTKARVLRLRARGLTYRAIADEIGISVQRVWQILKAEGATNTKKDESA